MVEKRLFPPLEGSKKKERARLILNEVLLARRIRDILEKECLPEGYLLEEFRPETLSKAFFSTLANLKDLGISLEQAKRMISPLTQLDKPTMPDANREELRKVKEIQGERIKTILQNAAIPTNVLNDNFFFIPPSTLEKILEGINEDLITLAPQSMGSGEQPELSLFPKRTGK